LASNGMESEARRFSDTLAIRSRVPLWTALGGPSGGGKTLGALRLAEGIRRIYGGLIYVIDTEADRALHYAPKEGEKANPPHSFDFRHLSFHSPFGSLDYLAAVRHCVEKGARVVIIDQFSSEHDGVGGMLEQFEEELERLSRGDEQRAERVKMLAWKRPKMARRKMVNELLQMPVSIIGCFRTKTKLKLQRGKDPVPLGYMPITGDELIYEFPLRLLLKAGSDGVPALSPEEIGEREWVRVPAFCREIVRSGLQLSEDMGEKLARWAEGGAASEPAADEKAERLHLLAEVQAALVKHWPGTAAADKKAKGEALGWAFGAPGWKAVEGLPLPALRSGLDSLQLHLEGRPGAIPFDDENDAAALEAEEERAALQAG
jgi:hypothetical protein